MRRIGTYPIDTHLIRPCTMTLAQGLKLGKVVHWSGVGFFVTMRVIKGNFITEKVWKVSRALHIIYRSVVFYRIVIFWNLAL